MPKKDHLISFLLMFAMLLPMFAKAQEIDHALSGFDVILKVIGWGVFIVIALMIGLYRMRKK